MTGSEEAIRRNIIAIKDFTQSTRDIVVENEKLIKLLQQQYLEQQKQINMYKEQIAKLQQLIYSKGS
jgi:uncharacterized protein YaiL (DUF2058 family)